MREALIFLSLNLLCISGIGAQTFEGNITDEMGNMVVDCYILVIDSANNTSLGYFIPDKFGFYSIKIPAKDSPTNITLKFQGLRYFPKSLIISLNNSESNTYRNNIILKNRTISLEEVFITADRPRIVEKKDTVVYKVSHFLTSKESKLIDVLEKLPGIQVNKKTGQVTYKGKTIESLLLDGDDLFGRSYSLGVRTISVDIIDEIEAIEDFHPNSIRKGLSKSDKVALNIKFKKNKSNSSGEGSVGLSDSNYSLNLNFINLSNQFKGFGVFNFNNTSYNITPFNNNTYNSENEEEIKNYALNYFDDGSIGKSPFFERSYSNNLGFGSYFNLVKVSKELSIKTNILKFNDKVSFSTNSNNTIVTPTDTFVRVDNFDNVLEPNDFIFENEINYNPNKSFAIKYKNKFIRKNSIYEQNILQNSNENFNSSLNVNKAYYHQILTISSRVSDSKLVEITAKHTEDDVKRLYNLGNEIMILENVKFENQKTTNKNSLFELAISYLVSKEKFNQEFIGLYGNAYQVLNYENIVDDFSDAFAEKKIGGIYKFQYQPNKKVFVNSEIFGAYYDQELNISSIPTNNLKADKFYLNSKLRLEFLVGKKSKLSAEVKNNNTPLDSRFFFQNEALINPRTTISNIPSLNFEKNREGLLRYINYNLLKQSSSLLSFSYKETKDTYISKQSISQNISRITYFQSPLKQEEINLVGSKTFFIDIINNKITLGSNMAFSKTYTVLNSENLNIVKNEFYNINFQANSAFEGFFNYKTNLSVSLSNYKQENLESFFNRFITGQVETNFRLAENTFLNIQSELLLPKSTNLTENQLFFDFLLSHRTKKGNAEFYLQGKNLLNKSQFVQIQNTEYSETIQSNSLFERFIILGVNYKF